MCLSATQWGAKGYLVTLPVGRRAQLNPSAGQSSTSCWDAVMRENVTWTLTRDEGAALLNLSPVCLTISLLAQGACVVQQEREGDRKPVILRGHFSEHNKHWLLCLTVCLFSDLLLGLSDWKWHWSHNILDYGYFCITLHSWEIPAVWLHHHSGAGSQVLCMLFRVCG